MIYQLVSMQFIYRWIFGVLDLPVNARPKTSSSGGTICFGVVVLFIDSLEGSMFGSLASSSSWDCML